MKVKIKNQSWNKNCENKVLIKLINSKLRMITKISWLFKKIMLGIADL